MKRLLLLTALFCFVSVSYGFTVDKITYTTLDDNSVKVTGFSFSLVDVVIPSEVTYNNVTYQVKEMGYKGLYGYNSSASTKYSKMETLVISEGIELLNELSIASNRNLKQVSLPSTLIEIGKKAFNNGTNIQSVIFPNGSNLLAIGEEAFNECENLEIFEIPSSVLSIGKYAFFKNKKMESFVIPENVTVIEEYTFGECSSLNTVILHDNLTHINERAFTDCVQLYNIDNNLPESLEFIGSRAFYGVPGFKHLVLRGNLKSIKSLSFANCNNLEYVWIQEGITSIGQSAFSGCQNLKYIVLPSTLKTIEQSGFGGFDNKNHISRSFIILTDEPFQTMSFTTTDYLGNSYPNTKTWSFGLIATDDCFFVKESAVESYRTKWSYYVPNNNIDYQIPFNADLTYSTNYREFDMDFHVAAESGNKPFVATSYNDQSATFTSIDDFIVPAETGIVIRKLSDENTWYQIAEQQGSSSSMNNYLKGVTYSDIITPTTEDGNVNFVLNNGVFCRFNNAGMLGDHKAYLQLPSQTAGSVLSFCFSDNSDGIIEIKNDNDKIDTIYNLNGIRVKHPKKGCLYIKNGKKIIY